MTKALLSKLSKLLGLASSSTSAGLVRPALTAVFALVAVVNYLLFPAVGLEAAELPKFFWYTLWGLAGIYSSLRTVEKTKGTAPDKEGGGKAKPQFDSNQVHDMIQTAIENERARRGFDPPTPEVEAEPTDAPEETPETKEEFTREDAETPEKVDTAPPEEL